MVADILEIFVDVFSGLVTAASTLVTTAFGALVYNPTSGLQPIAQWTLVFGAIGLVLGIINRFTRA